MSQHRILRSRSPDLVKQEIWGLLITHYATQVFITEAADELGADPDRYSYVSTINIIRRQVLNQAAIFPPHHLTPRSAKPSSISTNRSYRNAASDPVLEWSAESPSATPTSNTPTTRSSNTTPRRRYMS